MEGWQHPDLGEMSPGTPRYPTVPGWEFHEEIFDGSYSMSNRALQDKGRGMTADQLSKAMVPFGQIRVAGEVRSGTGLGLPLTKAMIEVGHKGSLTLESGGLGQGTTATMRVPVLWV